MGRLYDEWKLKSGLFKLGFAGAVVVVLLMVGGGVNRATAYFERRAFNKEIQSLKAEREQAKAVADAAERKAIEAENEKVKFQIAFEVAGKSIQQSLEKVNDAEFKYQQEITNIDVDADPCERARRIRANLHLPEKPCTTEEGNPR